MIRFKVIPGNSAVATQVKANGHSVEAVGKGITGYLEGDLRSNGTPDLEKPHRAHLELRLHSIKSGYQIEDAEMERRMDVRRYPNIVADVEKLESLGEGKYRATADVIVRGVSRSVLAYVNVGLNGHKLVADSEHIFDARDFGIDPPRVLMMKMSPDIRVKVHIEAELDSPQES